MSDGTDENHRNRTVSGINVGLARAKIRILECQIYNYYNFLTPTMSNVKDFAEYLFANRAKDLPPDGLAEVFDRLIWCLSDNGKQILRIQREWLASQDVEKVRIALEMNEAFPFESKGQMNEVLASIVSHWPQLRTKCEDAAARWSH